MARRASRLETAVATAKSSREKLISLRYLLARVTLDENITVRAARKDGMTWREIGDLLHMTESGCRRKYATRGIG